MNLRRILAYALLACAFCCQRIAARILKHGKARSGSMREGFEPT